MLSTLGWLIATIMVFIVAGTAAWAGLRAAPYVPTRQKDVRRMLEIADVQPGEVVYDLGAGDGRFVLTAAREKHATAVGYEISLLPYLVAWLRIRLARLHGRASMRFQDFYHHDLSAANVIVCFLTPEAMAKLGPQLEQQLRPGSRVVSYAFPIRGWQPVQKDKPEPRTMAVYLYRLPTEHN